ncbi:MAG: VOC family protein [Planctomycetes bacterium]|nr:VOC family protein [Planctomycetota bacterium]
MAPGFLLDHVVLAVPDLQAASRDLAALGFTVTPGGEHPNLGTRNALVPFADGSYLELLAFDAPQRPAPEGPVGNRWLRWRAVARGLVDFALCCGDAETAVDEAWRRGCPLLGPLPGSRKRPDGVEVAWKLAVPDAAELPFICADVTPRDLRVPPGPAREHPCGAAGIARVVVAVRDLEASARRYGALLGGTAREAGSRPCPDLAAARCAEFDVGGAAVVLAAPASAGSPLEQVLACRGEGPCALGLRTRDPARAGTLDPARTAGARVEMVV